MRIIKPATVKEWGKRHADAANALDKWLDLIDSAEWSSLVDLRKVFPSADPVKVESGHTVIVFNIGGNKYRLVAAVHFNQQIVFAMLFMTHAEYNKDRWKREL